jgi:mannitol-specific phosphotransferase system IIBC component
MKNYYKIQLKKRLERDEIVDIGGVVVASSGTLIALIDAVNKNSVMSLLIAVAFGMISIYFYKDSKVAREFIQELNEQ